MNCPIQSRGAAVAVSALVSILAGLLGFPGRTAAQCPPIWTSLSPAPAPVARAGHAMAYDSQRDVVVLFGGTNNANVNLDTLLNDTWEWNGATWTQRTPANAPPVRVYHAMAYDSVRGVTVLFGGYGPLPPSGLGADTWEWDGTNWTQRAPATVPVARMHHAMVFDAAGGVIVLFGGSPSTPLQPGSPLGDTWEWNGADWTRRMPATAPPARYALAMAYDSARHVTVLFGGGLALPTFQNPIPPLAADTWEWNGINWAARTPAVTPPARFTHSMAYGTQAKAVLFGGYPTSSLWEWDGTSWTQPTLGLAPSDRLATALAYDSGRGAMVLFGGGTFVGQGAIVHGDTWELRDATSAILQQPASTIAIEGLDAMFAVGMQSGMSCTYQWRKNGAPIGGANWAFHRIAGVGPSDAGSYDVIVTSASCQFTSDAATLTVRARADLNNNGSVNCQDLSLFIDEWTGPGEPPEPCFARGDTNCDGSVDFADIDSFVLALTGLTAYYAQFPECIWLNADCNCDGTVDFIDIEWFVACLQGSCACP